MISAQVGWRGDAPMCSLAGRLFTGGRIPWRAERRDFGQVLACAANPVAFAGPLRQS